MNIQGLTTRKDKEEYLMNFFQMLVKEMPEEGVQFTETEDCISLGKADYCEDLLSAVA